MKPIYQNNRLFLVLIAWTLQACATSDTFVAAVQESNRLLIYSDYELDSGGYIGQKILIPAQTIPAIKENNKYYIFIANEGYTTVAVYGTTSPPLGFCVPKDGSDSWRLYLNACAGKLKVLPNHEMINGAEKSSD